SGGPQWFDGNLGPLSIGPINAHVPAQGAGDGIENGPGVVTFLALLVAFEVAFHVVEQPLHAVPVMARIGLAVDEHADYPAVVDANVVRGRLVVVKLDGVDEMIRSWSLFLPQLARDLKLLGPKLLFEVVDDEHARGAHRQDPDDDEVPQPPS